jgi:hypothetical protein
MKTAITDFLIKQNDITEKEMFNPVLIEQKRKFDY